MNQNQTIVVFLIIGGAIATIAGAWWLSQRDATSGPSIAATPFRAQPGTEREQRLVFDAPPAAGPSSQEADPDATVPVGGEDAPPVEEEDGMAEAAADALANPDTEQGLEDIAAALAAASLAEASSLYAAAGQLYLQQSPPDEEASQVAFEQALATATDALGAQRAAVHLAELFVGRGDTAQALEVLTRVMPTTEPPATPSRAAVRLRLFQGGLFEDAGDTAKARACFEEAWENARVLYLAIGDEDAAAVYRQASLALARHHQRDGGHEAADNILARMRATLGES